VDLKDGVQLVDEAESVPVAAEDLAAAERCRCRSLLELVERLRTLLAR
jgi:hypothetical protein